MHFVVSKRLYLTLPQMKYSLNQFQIPGVPATNEYSVFIRSRNTVQLPPFNWQKCLDPLNTTFETSPAGTRYTQIRFSRYCYSRKPNYTLPFGHRNVKVADIIEVPKTCNVITEWTIW